MNIFLIVFVFDFPMNIVLSFFLFFFISNKHLFEFFIVFFISNKYLFWVSFHILFYFQWTSFLFYLLFFFHFQWISLWVSFDNFFISNEYLFEVKQSSFIWTPSPSSTRPFWALSPPLIFLIVRFRLSKCWRFRYIALI